MKHKSFFLIIFIISGFLAASLSCLGLEGSLDSIIKEITTFVSEVDLDIDSFNDKIDITPPNIVDNDKYTPYFGEEEVDPSAIVYTMYYLTVADPDAEAPTPEKVKADGGVLNEMKDSSGAITFDIESITQADVFPSGAAYYITVDMSFPDGTSFLSPIEIIRSLN